MGPPPLEPPNFSRHFSLTGFPPRYTPTSSTSHSSSIPCTEVKAPDTWLEYLSLLRVSDFASSNSSQWSKMTYSNEGFAFLLPCISFCVCEPNPDRDSGDSFELLWVCKWPITTLLGSWRPEDCRSCGAFRKNISASMQIR